MFRAIFIGGALFWGVCYAASKYARNKLAQKQNPLAPFGT